MREVKEVTYIDFLGNEYEEENKAKAFEEEHKNLSDIAKIVQHVCMMYNEKDSCLHTTNDDIEHPCPFLSSYGECVFRKKFGYDYFTLDWEFENNNRFSNGDLVKEIFD